MAGKRGCPCCPNTEEPKAVSLSTANVATTLAPADQLWSASRDKAVRLRMEGSGPASETPITIHQMFLETVEKYPDHPALASKKEGQWVMTTWRQYYEQCRAAAKSFLKVCLFELICCLHILCKTYYYCSAIRKYLTHFLVCWLSTYSSTLDFEWNINCKIKVLIFSFSLRVTSIWGQQAFVVNNNKAVRLRMESWKSVL